MKLRETLESIRSLPVPSNEEETKNKVVVRILSVLGWDTYGDEFQYEYPVGTKRNPDKVDIALKKGRHPVALVEAKAPDQRLELHVDQVLGYAFHEGVDLCALTTGLEWWLYLPRQKGPPSERRFTVLNVKEGHIDQLVDDFERFLGRENLLSGEAEKRAEQVLEARREEDRLNTVAPNIWEFMLAEPDDELVDLLGKRIYDEVGLRPTRKLVRTVLQNASTPGVLLPSQPKPEPRPRGLSKKPTGFNLWGVYNPVTSYRQVLAGVAEAIYERHRADFGRMLTLRGNKHPYVSRNSEDVSAPYEIGISQYYIDTKLSGPNTYKRALLFLTTFGYPDTDLEIFYE